MDSSRRAVESYWRSRMIDGATSDEDKVTPVYKLDEICELMRSSHASIVKEISDFILKRLEHKSPIVKQKALRLIKYAVGKSCGEFRREMQRHSVAVRQLFHYKGQLDPLKADALNKAVRDTAHEAIAAIFSAEENKAAPSENLNKRIEGFGNTNFEMQSVDKKSFLSDMVDLGSASIKQGLSSFTQAHTQMKNETGSYKSPYLRRSLTSEIDYKDKYESSINGSSGTWGQESRTPTLRPSNGESSSSYAQDKTREEKLVDTIVTSGGVRLQPTRDAIQIFLGEAVKLDAVLLSLALESKIQSPSWQVCMKAVCVLEAILRRKDDEHFFVVATYFGENKDCIARCSESPQASLKEKANKVLSLLDGGQVGTTLSHLGKTVKSQAPTVIEMPNLIDTGDSNNDHGVDESAKNKTNFSIANPTVQTTPFDDIFGDNIEQNAIDDPFADVSFHTSERKEPLNDPFQGILIEESNTNEIHKSVPVKNGPELSDVFGTGSSSNPPTSGVNDLMAGLSISGSKNNLNDVIGPQMTGTNANAPFPIGSMPYNMPHGFMPNQTYLFSDGKLWKFIDSTAVFGYNGKYPTPRASEFRQGTSS